MNFKVSLAFMFCALSFGAFALGRSLTQVEAPATIADDYSVHSDYLGGLPEGIVVESNIWVQPGALHAANQGGRLLCFLDITALDADGRAIAHVAGPTEVLADSDALHTSGNFSMMTSMDELVLAEVLFAPPAGSTWGSLTMETPVSHSLVIHE